MPRISVESMRTFFLPHSDPCLGTLYAVVGNRSPITITSPRFLEHEVHTMVIHRTWEHSYLTNKTLILSNWRQLETKRGKHFGFLCQIVACSSTTTINITSVVHFMRHHGNPITYQVILTDWPLGDAVVTLVIIKLKSNIDTLGARAFSVKLSWRTQVMAWCRQATSHYMNQCRSSSMTPYSINKPQ